VEAAVPFVDLARQHRPLQAELRAAFERVVGASAFTLGAEVDAFEAEFSAYCGARHCVGVASGTAALALLFEASGIGPGDEVVVPAHTFIASALAVRHAGAKPVLCDVDERDGLIDAEAAAAAITPRTTAILAVHLYGQTCDMEPLARLARRHGLMLLEDAAQGHGAEDRGRRAGALADAAAFSFYPTKNLGAFGDGGAVCTDDERIAERVRQLRNLGQRRKGEHLVAGYNERLDGLQAALLRVKLPRLDEANELRRAHAAAYAEALDPALRPLAERAPRACVFHLLPVRVPDRAALADRLSDHGVGTGVHYSPPLHLQPPFRDGHRRDDFPNAAAWADEELSLPMFPGLEAREIERVVAICARSVEVVG
jgi:dTDP-3-amino-3,4,6-trideoxy-alpha-D-glucose transaminase